MKTGYTKQKIHRNINTHSRLLVGAYDVCSPYCMHAYKLDRKRQNDTILLPANLLWLWVHDTWLMGMMIFFCIYVFITEQPLAAIHWRLQSPWEIPCLKERNRVDYSKICERTTKRDFPGTSFPWMRINSHGYLTIIIW